MSHDLARMTPQEIVETGLQVLGPDRGTVLVEARETVNLRWANSSLTTNGLASSQQVHVVAHPSVGGGLGSGTASGVVTERADLEDLVARARAAALGGGAAQDEAPPAPAITDAAWEEPPAHSGPEALAPVSALLGEILPVADVTHFGYAEHDVTTSYLGTTGGVRRRHLQPAARFELCGKSPDRTRSSWTSRAGRDFSALDLTGSSQEIRRGLAAQARHVDVSPGRHRVLLSPSAAADLLVYLLWSAGALDAVEGHSAFSAGEGRTLVGQQVSEAPFWLRSDPGAQGLQCADHVRSTTSGPLSSAFDAGLPLGPTDWIAQGQVRALLTTRRSARLSGLADTPFVDNLQAGVDELTGSLDDVAARIGDGLVVTCLWYIREVDARSLLLTGLTRDGVYVVRGGEIVGAAGNFRFNESPLGMLRRIADAGTPVDCLPREWGDWFTRTRIAPLAIDGFNLSTRSEAV